MFTTKRVSALLTAALLLTLALVFLVGGHAQKASANAESGALPTTQSAAEFTHDFIGVTNTYAEDHGDTRRVGNAHCVQASPGRYMCSYTVTRDGTSTCHLMQATWTPDRPSTITVTLAGRTQRCGTLREAIQSLR